MSDTPEAPQTEAARSNTGTMIAVTIAILFLLGAIYFFMRPNSVLAPEDQTNDSRQNESSSTIDDPDKTTFNQLANTKWNLISYADDSGQEILVPTNLGINSDFTSDMVGGTGGCNSYSGTYTSSENTISIFDISMTAMSCGEETDVNESSFLRQLGISTTFQITKDTLTMYDDSGKVTLKYLKTY